MRVIRVILAVQGEFSGLAPHKQTLSEPVGTCKRAKTRKSRLAQGMSDLPHKQTSRLVRSRGAHIGYTWMCGCAGEFNGATFSGLRFSQFARRVEHGIRNRADMRMDPPEITQYVKMEGRGFY